MDLLLDAGSVGGVEPVQDLDGGSQLGGIRGAADYREAGEVPEMVRQGRGAHLLRVPDLTLGPTRRSGRLLNLCVAVVVHYPAI